MESFALAIRAGISPGEFWGLTPTELRAIVPARGDALVTQAWLTAKFQRVMDFPELAEVLPSEQMKPPAPEADRILALLVSQGIEVIDKRPPKGTPETQNAEVQNAAPEED